MLHLLQQISLLIIKKRKRKRPWHGIKLICDLQLWLINTKLSGTIGMMPRGTFPGGAQALLTTWHMPRTFSMSRKSNARTL